jgi:iron transport multicopper oxidase
VAGVNLASSAFTLWTDESGVTYNEGGIWQSGGGLMSDGAGRIFFTSGNGVSPSVRAGGSPGGQLAESVVRLGVSASGTLAAKDFFSPGNAPTLDAADTDFGAGGPVGVPFGTATWARRSW